MLKVPFGIRNGELVEPAHVPNGKACGCVCPGCSRPLVAYNQGKVRTTQYFGHLPGIECAKGFESAIHLAGKQAVVNAKRMSLPALEVGPAGIAHPKYTPTRSRVLETATAAIYRAVDAEVTIEVSEPKEEASTQSDLFAVHNAPESKTQLLRPDLKAQRGTEVDWIEIRVTHAVDARKVWLMQHAGLRVVEVDLSSLLRVGVTLNEVRRAVLDDPTTKTWLAHPQARATATELQDERRQEAEQEALEDALRRQQEERQPRTRRINGSAALPFQGPAQIPPPPPAQPTEVQRLHELRGQLGLAVYAPWPRYLDLDLAGNGGSQVSPRVWLSRLYLDWVRGRRGARYFISDLQASAAAKFGVKSFSGHRDLRLALERRVLPYWAACGLVTVAGEVVVVTSD